MFAEGRAFAEEALRIAEAAAHPPSLMFACIGSGLLCLHQGDLPRALSLLERAVSICKDMDLMAYFSWAASALGTAYTLTGHITDAVSLLTQAIERATAMEIVHNKMLCRLSLGETQLQAGRLEEAHALAEGALAQAREHQEYGSEAYALRLFGEIAVRRHPPEIDQAETHYQQALTLANELSMRPLQAHCHRGLGTLYGQIGQSDQALDELTTAIELYRDMEMTFWLPETEAAWRKVADKG